MLGAITKGQRQTGGQGLFRADDNPESIYARAALRQLYLLLYTGKVEGCSLQAFEDATGLRLTDGDGSLREDLPPITTFLNRLLALTISLQNTLFAVSRPLAPADGAPRDFAWRFRAHTLGERPSGFLELTNYLSFAVLKRSIGAQASGWKLVDDELKPQGTSLVRSSRLPLSAIVVP
jgi:hypothetical protein